MITYKFISRKERNNAVMLRLTANRKSSELSLGISLPHEILEETVAGVASKQYKDQSLVVKYYQNVIADLIAQLTDKETKTITAAEFQKRIRNEIDGRRNPGGSSAKGDVLEVFKDKIESLHNPNSKDTYTLALSKICEFCTDENNRYYKKPEQLMFEDINNKWLSAFDGWMTKKGLSVNSKWLHMMKLRVVANKALDEEIIDKDPFRRFKIKKEATRKRSLSVEDLRRLFSYQGTKAQQFYIDMFKLIFMLCGINSVDLYGLKHITRDGRIEYRRAKTGRLYSIKIEPEAMEIINKYKGEDGLLMLSDRFKSSRIFTILTDRTLKVIGAKIDARLVEIGEKSDKEESDLSQISTYWARHSWATIARKLKISKDDIALALGHSSGHNVTEIYINEDLEAVDAANRHVLDYVLYGKS